MNEELSESQPSVSDVRRERERRMMRERIMDVAREMFVRDGYEAVTLRKVAKAIEYSPGAIYQYFKDKQSLVEAIIRADSQDFRDHLLECLESEDPVERVLEMARRFCKWAIGHPNHYRLMLAPPPAWSDHHEKLHEEAPSALERESLFVLLSIVQDGIRRGLLKDKYEDPSLVASTLWAAFHGAVIYELTMRPFQKALLDGAETSFEARFETLTEVLQDGFLKGRDE